MAKVKMHFKRRREGKTDYKKRLKLLYSKKPRLVIRKSLRYITAQIIEFEKIGDKAILSATSKELKKLGWTYSCDSTPAAYLVGLIIGKRAVKKGIEKAVVDIGLHPSTVGSRIYAAVKGALDAGLDIDIDEKVFPREDRIKGKHINENIVKKFERVKEMIK